MGLAQVFKKKTQQIRNRLEGLGKRFEDPAFRRNARWLLLGLGLLACALILFLILNQSEQGERFAVPRDDGVLTLHTTVHPRSPLAPGIKAFRQGYVYRAISHFKEALQGKLRPVEKRKIHNYLGNIYLAMGRKQRAREQFGASLRVDGNNAPARHGMGRIHQLSGQQQDAARWYRQALNNDASCLRSRHRLGEVYLALGDVRQAMTQFRRYLARRENALIRYLLGRSLARLKDTKQALAQYRKVLDLASNRVLLGYACARIADIHDAAGRVQQAIKFYRQATARYPAQSRFHYNLGVLLLKQGRVQEAIASFRRVMDSSKGKERAALSKVLGELYYDSGDYRRALHFMRQATRGEKDPDVIAVLADLYYLQKRHDRALYYYRLIIDTFPRSEMALAALVNAGTIHMQRGALQQALEYYQKAQQLDNKLPLLFYNKGIALWKAGRKDDAVSSLLRAYSLDHSYLKAVRAAVQVYLADDRPRRALALILDILGKTKQAASELYLQAGRLQYLLGDYAAARQQFRLALRLDLNPAQWVRAYLGLARIHITQGQPEQAYPVLRKAATRARSNPMLHYLYGMAYLQEKRTYDAESAFEAALLYHPGARLRAELFYNLGNLAFRKGDYRKALAHYERTLDAFPEHSYARYNATQCRRQLLQGEGAQ